MICAFLWIRCFETTKGQSTFRFADSLYQQGQFEAAALAYERVVFQSENKTTQTHALLQKSKCQKQAALFSQAVATLRRSEPLHFPDSLAVAVHYELILNLYLNRDFNKAVTAVEQLDLETHAEKFLKSLLLLRILVYNESGQWTKANAALQNYLSAWRIEADSSEIADITSLPLLKSQLKARRLARALPGLGQVYAGYPLRGFSAFLLTGGTFALGVYGITEGYYLSGILSGGLPALRTYRGSVAYTQRLVEERNNQRLSIYRIRYKSFVLGLERNRATAEE